MGIALFVVPPIVRIVLLCNGYQILGQDLLVERLMDPSSIYTVVSSLLIIGLVFPILEEFVFRFWIKCGKTQLRMLLFVVMGCYTAIGSFWYIGVAGAAACILADYLLRNKEGRRTPLLFVMTSVVFAVGHIGGFSEYNANMVLYITQLFGLGLILCWLMYNVGFWMACLLHVINNLISLAVIMSVPTPMLYTPDPTSYDTTTYSACLQPLDKETIDFKQINDSTIVIKGHLTNIAGMLVENFNPDIVDLDYSHTEYFRYRYPQRGKLPYWELTLIFHDTIPYRHAPYLASDLASHSRLSIDTTYEDIYIIGIEDEHKVNESKGNINTTLAGFAVEMRMLQDWPFVLDDGVNELYPFSYDQSLFRMPYSFDELSELLSEKMGLYVYKSDVHKIQVINFSDSEE